MICPSQTAACLTAVAWGRAGSWARHIRTGDFYFFFHLDGGNQFICEARASTPVPVPTVSQWGMVFIVLLLLTGLTIVLRRSRPYFWSNGAAQ